MTSVLWVEWYYVMWLSQIISQILGDGLRYSPVLLHYLLCSLAPVMKSADDVSWLIGIKLIDTQSY